MPASLEGTEEEGEETLTPRGLKLSESFAMKLQCGCPRLRRVLLRVTLLLLGALFLCAPPVAQRLSAYAALRETLVKRPDPRGPCFDDPALWACRKWLTDVLPARRLDIVLVANELFQQFPLIGYGGIETTVQISAGALHAMRLPFWVITPGRAHPVPRYPYDVLETPVAPNGRGGLAHEFVMQGIALMAARADAAGGNLTRVDAAHAAAGSAPADSDTPELVVWGQSDWSQAFSMAAGVAAMIASHHDGNGAVKGWDRQLPRVGHRFLCDNQRDQWVRRDDAYNIARTRIVGHGMPSDEFFTCEDGGYFLWVASLDWGWEEKGLHIFVESARRDPSHTYVAYGGGRRGLVDRLLALNKELPNFHYRGELLRGEEHTRTFCEATAFFMPTQLSESFGMTVIEALAKGVPVITSTRGAPADILRVPGRKGDSPYGAACDSMEEYAAAARRLGARSRNATLAVQAFARANFHSFAIVEALLRFTLDVMAWGDASGPPDPAANGTAEAPAP